MSKPIFETDDLPPEPIAEPNEEKLKDTMAWGTELRHIIDEFKDSDEGHLNETEVSDLVNIIRAKIELLEGLITEKEYNKRLNVGREKDLFF